MELIRRFFDKLFSENTNDIVCWIAVIAALTYFVFQAVRFLIIES